MGLLELHTGVRGWGREKCVWGLGKTVFDDTEQDL